MADSLAVAKFQAQTCNLPSIDRSKLVLTSFISITSLTAAIVLLRLASKMMDSLVSLEDYVVFSSMILACVANAMVILFVHAGFGRHLYSLQNGDLLKVLRYFYIGENIYVVALGLVKLSILSFYLRIFRHQDWFRAGVYVAIFIVIAGTSIISLLTIFQCHPVQYFWNKDISSGICLNQNALAYANSGLSIAQDIIIITLPIPVVLKMNMGVRKKIGVAFMFAVGGFGCVVSIIRLQSLLVFGNSIDPTWDYVPVTIWTGLELGAGIVCSCLPALRTLAQKIFPTFNFSLLSSRSSGSGTVHTKLSSLRSRFGRHRFVELVHIENGTLDIKWNESTGIHEHVELIDLPPATAR